MISFGTVSPKWIPIRKILIFDNFIIVEHRCLMISRNSIDAIYRYSFLYYKLFGIQIETVGIPVVLGRLSLAKATGSLEKSIHIEFYHRANCLLGGRK